MFGNEEGVEFIISLYRDVNTRAFLREAQKLVPSVTEDMVEVSASYRNHRFLVRVHFSENPH